MTYQRPYPDDACRALVLEDLLWTAYSGYVLANCEPRPDGDGYDLDDTARELLDLAISWETHRVF